MIIAPWRELLLFHLWPIKCSRREILLVAPRIWSRENSPWLLRESASILICSYLFVSERWYTQEIIACTSSVKAHWCEGIDIFMSVFRQRQDIFDFFRKHLIWVELCAFLLHLGHQLDLNFIVFLMSLWLCAYALVLTDLWKHIQVTSIWFGILWRQLKHLSAVFGWWVVYR